MSTYKALVGKKIKSVSSDPSDSADGQMWYNTTTQSLRGLAVTEAWASGSPLPTINYGAGGAGSQTAMLYFGGANYTGSPPYPGSITNATYEYNGVGWSSSGNYTGSAVYVSGCGTQTAALGAGGFTGTATFTASAEYNGSTWTAGNSMSQQRHNAGTNMVGTQPAALITGGDQYPSTPRSVTACEEYDGTNWTSGGAYPVAIQNTAQAGTQTAGWAAGGASDTNPGTPNVTRDATNHYDGSSWSAGGTLPAVNFRAGAAGTQTAGLIFGGSPNTTNTFAYDGTTWTAKPALALARHNIGSGGVSSTTTAAIGAGGYAPSAVSATTEEFTASTNVITGAAWASGGALGTGGYNFSGCGTQTAGLGFARYTQGSPNIGNTEEYDGSTWSEQGDLSTGRFDSTGFGVQTAAVCAGGKQDPGSAVASTEEYGGSSWSAGEDLPAARRGGAGVGILTAGLVCGGEIPGFTDTTLSYDGTDYSSAPTLNTARSAAKGSGTSTAGLIFGGVAPGPSVTGATEEYNGSSWSNGGTLPINLVSFGQSGNGTQDSSIAFGGTSSSPLLATTFGYDGTSWSTRPNMATARIKLGGLGTEPLALAFGGGLGPSTGLTTTEEFTGETTAANVETFSTS